jgi:hypothetical protein
MFTVEIKVNGQLILSRSCNRIAGEKDDRCLYISDNGHYIEHDYAHGAAVLAVRLLWNVSNILSAAHLPCIRQWEKNNMKRRLDEIPTEQTRSKKRNSRR